MYYHERSKVFVSEFLNGSGVLFVFAGRAWGSFNPNQERGVPEKILDVLRSLGFDKSFRTPLYGKLVHGDRIVVCTETTPYASLVGADAFITETAGLPLLMYVADCSSVGIFDPHQKVAALVHSGRNGTALNVCGKVVRAMVSRFGSRPGNLVAVLSPYIGACRSPCYELDHATAMPFANAYPDCVVERRDGKMYLDLGVVVSTQLRRSGVSLIESTTLCTWCKQGLYSYRRRNTLEKLSKPNNGAILCLL